MPRSKISRILARRIATQNESNLGFAESDNVTSMRGSGADWQTIAQDRAKWIAMERGFVYKISSHSDELEQ